jgi:hypothetical protein
MQLLIFFKKKPLKLNYTVKTFRVSSLMYLGILRSQAFTPIFNFIIVH